jgi:hypothetical protein
MGPTYVCNFYLVKNQKVTNNPFPTKAREKVNADSKALELKNIYA